MSGGSITNVRLVKCPKCNGLLQELADVPVYRCAGCQTVLQGDLGHTSDDKESSSPSQNGSHITAIGNNGNLIMDCISKTEEGNISNAQCIGNEVSTTDGGNSGQNELLHIAHDSKSTSNDEMHIASARGLFLTNNLPDESSTPATRAPCGLYHTVDCPSSFSSLGSETLCFTRTNSSTVNDATIALEVVQCQSKEEVVVQSSQKIGTHENAPNYESSGADEVLMKRKRRPINVTDSTHRLNASIPVKGVYGGVDSASSFSSPGGGQLQSTVTRGSSPKEDGSGDESNHCDVIQRQSSGKAEDSEKSSPSGYDIINLTHELETTTTTDVSLELRGTVRKMFKSATTKSGYGYYGSISSYEEQDHQIHRQTFRHLNYTENDGRRNFHTNKVSSVTDMQQAREFFFSEKYQNLMPESLRSHIEPHEPLRHKIRNQIEAEMYPSKAPLNIGGYENSGNSSDWLGGAQSESSICSTHKLPYAEKDRIELLKMVYKLQDELKYTVTTKRNIDRRNLPNSWNGRQMPAPHKHREFMYEAGLQLKFSRYPFTRSEQGTNWPPPQNPSWIPFSGEATKLRHDAEYSCQHCLPVDQRFSAQLAPSVCSLNSGLHKVHLHHGNQCCDPYSSSTSSPQRHMEAEFPSRVQDVTYFDHKLMERYADTNLSNSTIDTYQACKDKVKKFHAREKKLPFRRHIRPIAGGAPYITCYQCWTPLQLPADSFLFKRRLHELKCGCCSKILKLSLENRTHIVPYVHDYRAPPPSEGKGRSPVNNGTSHLNISSHSHAIQTSCSDNEFGNSFSRSCSTTEEEQVSPLAAPAHVIQASNGGGREISSRDTSDILEGREKHFSKHFSFKDKRPMEMPETAGPSTYKTFNIENYSSEQRKAKPRSVSPLHKLMGYTSMNQVFCRPTKGTSESFCSKSAR